MTTLAGENVHVPKKAPRVPKTTRFYPKAIAEVMSLGDDAAARFGEGARPEFSEILRLLLQYALRDASTRRQVRNDLVRVRIKR